MSIQNNDLFRIGDKIKSLSTIIEKSESKSDDDPLNDRIRELSREIIENGTHNILNDQNCNTIIDRSLQIISLLEGHNEQELVIKFKSTLSDLSNIAISLILGKLDERDNFTYFSDFLKLNEETQNQLLQNSQFLEKIINLIFELGPNFLISPQIGLTLLILLADHSNPEVRKLAIPLLEHPKVDLTLSTRNGYTALHRAALKNDEYLTQAFLDKNANPVQSNNKKEIPFDLATWTKVKVALVKSVPLEKIIEGTFFVERVLKWLTKEVYSVPQSLNILQLATYLKNHESSEEIGNLLSETYNFELLIALIGEGYIPQGFTNEKLASIVEKCIERHNIEALQTILNSGLLPYNSVNDKDFFRAIESDESLQATLERELAQAKSAFTPEALKAYQILFNNLLTNSNNIRQTLLLEEVDKSFQILITNNTRGAVEAKLEYDASSLTISNRESLSEARRILNSPMDIEAKVLEIKNKKVFYVLKNLAWIEKNDELLSELEQQDPWIHDSEEKSAVDKIIANVALDKLYFPEKSSYAAGNQSWIAPYFANALQLTGLKLRNEATLSLELLESSQKIIRQIHKELLELSRWTKSDLDLELDSDDNKLLKFKDLVNRVQSLPEGSSVLIPVATLTHAMVLRIEKTEKGTYHAVFYNTGQGLNEYHKEGERKGSYQTFLEYSHIPLNTEMLEVFLRNFSDVSSVYQSLDLLCKNGIKHPPSRFPEFYEETQKSGSCAYQCFLAMIRERLISSADNPKEGLALYKIIKGLLIESFEEKTRKSRSQDITSLLQPKLHFIGLEIKIIKAIAELGTRKALLENVQEELKNQKLNALSGELQHSENPILIFGVLRKAIRLLALSKLPLQVEGLVREAVEARREKYNLNRQYYLENLDKFLNNPSPEDIDAWAKSFGSQFMGGILKGSAIEWAITRLREVPKNTENEKPSDLLLKRLVKGINRQALEKREKILFPLLRSYETAGNHSMIAYFQSECFIGKKQNDISSFEY
jgi:ankyrin repeat protein